MRSPALPRLLELLRGEIEAPEGWTWNVTPQMLTLSESKHFGWAAEKIVPILYQVAIDEKAESGSRTRATSSLIGLGDKGLAKLRLLTGSSSREVRKQAHYALAERAPQGREAYFAELLEEEPCDHAADDYLSHTKKIVNAGKLHPLTERTKVGIRECLEKDPDPELAMTSRSHPAQPALRHGDPLGRSERLESLALGPREPEGELSHPARGSRARLQAVEEGIRPLA